MKGDFVKLLALVILLITMAVRTELYPIIILYMQFFGCLAIFGNEFFYVSNKKHKEHGITGLFIY